MASQTSHYGLKKLVQGDKLSDEGYKFTNADRDQVDRLLFQGAEGHHHTGAGADSANPTLAPVLTQDNLSGNIPAGTTVRYKYTYVNSSGLESAPSPEAFINTPAAIANPGTPVLSNTTTGGSLPNGNYYYVLSAYQNVTTSETKATNPAYITVPVGTSTNKIRVTFPTLPAGATGFNVYVRKPGGTQYFFLISVDETSPVAYFDDDGTVEQDCNRTLPTSNTTNSTNNITITLPGATPTVPAGFTWKIYRTYVISNYTNSFLHWVVETTVPGVVDAFYNDTGQATSNGSPPSAAQFTSQPTKIDLDNMAEIQGMAPMGAVSGFPFIVTFALPGNMSTPLVGTAVWVCDFPAATIVACRASLGVGSTPASQKLIVDVNKGTGATPTYTTIFTTQENRPFIYVGQQIGPDAAPDVTDLLRGDSLSIDLDQVGGGATPTDHDLTVNVYMIVYGYGQTSYPWPISVTSPAGTGV